MPRLSLAVLPLLVTLSCLAQVKPSAAGPRDEPFRPQVHFSPESHWMNDPNGLVFFEGEYHLFFQFNPFGDTPGHISWGHAVSTDLLHWRQLPVAIPEADGAMIFTGSVVVDVHNTSGLCLGVKPCLVAIYTANRGSGATQLETQEIASSQDRGRTWQRFAGNPVLDLKMTDFRDPSVAWNELGKNWLMAVSLPNDHYVAFYTSPDLKQWTRVSTFGPAGTTDGQWECPDLLHVPDASGGGGLWALKVGLNPGSLQGGSGEQYFLGAFDGKRFTPSTEPGAHGWSDYGKDSYCAISYNHLSAGEKPTLIGWMDNWQYADHLPTSPWRGQMTLPRRVTAVHDADGLALKQEPVVVPLRQGPGVVFDKAVSADPVRISLPRGPSAMELVVRFDAADAKSFGLRILSDSTHQTEIGFDRTGAVLYVDRTHSGGVTLPGFQTRTDAPLAASRPFNLHIIVDRSSIEVFAQDGTIAMTNLVFPTDPDTQIEFFQKEGTRAIHAEGEMWTLTSVWQHQASTARAVKQP